MQGNMVLGFIAVVVLLVSIVALVGFGIVLLGWVAEKHPRLLWLLLIPAGSWALWYLTTHHPPD